MAKITSPVKGYTGTRVGIAFANGVAETDNASAIAYFRRHGYGIEMPEPETPPFPEGEPTEKWTADELKAYAAAKDIDLGDAKKKADIVAALTKPANTADTQASDAADTSDPAAS